MNETNPYFDQKLRNFDEALQDLDENPGLQKLAQSSQVLSNITDVYGNPQVSVQNQYD